MWTTGTTHFITRLTSSTLFANSNVLSMFNFDHRSVASTSSNESTVINRMRGLKARSPYALYVKQNYADFSSKNPDLKLAQISKKIAESWKNLTEDKKQTFYKQFQDQKNNYEKEKKQLSATDFQIVDSDEKSRRVEQRVRKSIQQLPTKRPRSAYAHFLSSLDRGEAELKEFMKGAAQRWSQLSTDEKQKFEQLYQEEKRQYIKALVNWAMENEKIGQTQPKETTKKVSTRKSRTKSVTAKKRTTSATNRSKSKKKTSRSTSRSSSSSDRSKSNKKKSS